jgi:hypothetical protein
MATGWARILVQLGAVDSAMSSLNLTSETRGGGSYTVCPSALHKQIRRARLAVGGGSVHVLAMQRDG